MQNLNYSTSSKRRRHAVLNHNAIWKYAVLIIAIVIMALSALPTWYGENAAIQISPKAGLNLTPPAVVNTLAKHQIAVRRLDSNKQGMLVVLTNNQQQTQAKELLASFVKNPEQLTLAMTPSAPKWLLNLGFEPIKLGLDLRGGVQFLLDVDVAPVYHQQSEGVSDAVRQFARDNQLYGVRIHLHQNNELQINTSDLTQAKIESFLRRQYPTWNVSPTKHGLTLSLNTQEKVALRNMTVEQNLQIMRSRIEELGITEASVQRQGESHILIELPGVQDPAAAKDVIGATATLKFYAVMPEGSRSSQLIKDTQGKPISVAKQPVLTGEHILDARAGNGEMGQAEVNITLDSVGGDKMTSFSKTHIGKPMATAYSEYSRDPKGQLHQTNQIISVATIQNILPAKFRITGIGSYEHAQQLALLLRAGSMTAPVTIVEERTIGPSLGAENIHNGFAALALGMAVTLLFMALWYRRLGWVANLALIANMVLLFGLIALIPGAVLTLPGIAGLVLTVGMAVDTNVLIFERIRDKLKEGRSFALAIDRGFDSAFATIFDANFTTMITAVVLYAIGNGPIKGFALTLGLGLLTSMFTGIFASRAIINLAYGRNQSRDVRV